MTLVVDEPTTFVYAIDMQAQRFVYASRSSIHLLGRTPDELCASDSPGVGEFLVAESQETGGDPTMGRTLSLRHADGTTRWLQAREVVLDQDASGQIRLLLGYGRDVTRPREAYVDLGLHKHLLRMLNRIVEAFSVLPADADMRESVTDAMSLVGPIVGATRFHLCRIEDRDRLPIKLSISHEWHRQELMPAREGFEHVPVNLFPWFFGQVDQGRPVCLATRGQLPDSDRILNALLAARKADSYLALPLVDGDITWGFVGLVPEPGQTRIWDEDVMALLRLLGQVFVNRMKYGDANRQILESEIKWRQTADAAYDLVLLLNPESLVIDASTKRLDVDESRFLGRDVFSLVDPASYRRLRNAISSALSAKSVDEGARSLELQAPGPGGELTWYRARVSPRMRGQSAVGVNLFATIIQGQKEAAARIAELSRELEQASRLSVLGQMATEIAHELNQPLQVISSYAEGLRLRLAGLGDQDGLLSVTDQIVAAAADAASTVRNIREFVQHRVVESGLTSMEEIIHSSLALAEPVVRDNDAIVECSIEPSLPPVLVNAAQINHVLLNLIVNGIEAAAADSEVEQIEIQIDCRLDSGGEQIEVRVADNGPGVPAEKREAIFTRYVTTKEAGLGVGLASSRDVVQRYGGDLILIPRPAIGNRGALFRFTLPLSRPQPESDTLRRDSSEPPLIKPN